MLVAKWVKEHLDDEWHAWFNINWLPVPEIDLVLAHAVYGVSVIEVKGHSLDEIVNFGPQAAEFSDGQKRHPAQQARTASQKLSSWAKGLGTTPPDGVPWIASTGFFPRIRREDFLGRFDHSEVIRQTQSMLFANDSDGVGQFIQGLQRARTNPAFGGDGPRIARNLRAQVQWFTEEINASMNAPDLQNTPGKFTSPNTRSGADNVASDIASEYPWGEEGSSNVVFRGLPATGKTSILLQIARQHAHLGAKVLYVTYNKTLATNVRGETARMSNEDEEFGVGPDGGWKITALDLWQLYSYVTDLQLPAKMASRHYVRWERKYDKKLARALEKFTERFDTILIDEAQDISEVGFRYAMALKDSDASLFLAIGEGQSLYQDDLAPSLIQWMSQVDDDRHLFRSFRKSHASDLVIKAFVDHGIDNEAATKSLENIRREQKAQKSAGQPQGHGTIDQIRNAGSITLREREGSSLDPAVYQWELHEYLRKWREESADGVVDALVIFRRKKDIDSSAVRVTLQGGGIPYTDLLQEGNRRNPTPERGVRLATFHSSRGLRAKYAIVFGFDTMRDLPHEHHLAAVALSRATEETIVVVAKESPSPYLRMLRTVHSTAQQMRSV